MYSSTFIIIFNFEDPFTGYATETSNHRDFWDCIIDTDAGDGLQLILDYDKISWFHKFTYLKYLGNHWNQMKWKRQNIQHVYVVSKSSEKKAAILYLKIYQWLFMYDVYFLAYSYFCINGVGSSYTYLHFGKATKPSEASLLWTLHSVSSELVYLYAENLEKQCTLSLFSCPSAEIRTRGGYACKITHLCVVFEEIWKFLDLSYLQQLKLPTSKFASFVLLLNFFKHGVINKYFILWAGRVFYGNSQGIRLWTSLLLNTRCGPCRVFFYKRKQCHSVRISNLLSLSRFFAARF